MKTILLINTGTPKASTTSAVHEYLTEFLMDPGVISLPWILRVLLVRGLIVPLRAPRSAAKYQKIWTEEGSPLLAHTVSMQRALQKKLATEFRVEVAMRYGNPAIEKTMLQLKEEGVKELIIFPQYPQYADATTESINSEVKRVQKKLGGYFSLQFISAFYAESFYVRSLTQIIESELQKNTYDHLLFTYHGLPIKQVRWNTPELNYKRHCDQTTQFIIENLKIKKHSQSFQSRLGPMKWLEPSTESELTRLAQEGVKKIAVVAPSFTVDCLETLEEIAIEGKNSFLREGGESFHYIPCLNAHELWIDNLTQHFKLKFK